MRKLNANIMERIYLTKNEKYILFQLNKIPYGACNADKLPNLNGNELKSAVESLEYKDLAVDDVPVTGNVVACVALTVRGKQYLKENPKLKNPNKLLLTIGKYSKEFIITLVLGLLIAFLTWKFGWV